MSESQPTSFHPNEIVVPEALPESPDTVRVRIDEPVEEEGVLIYTLRSQTRNLTMHLEYGSLLYAYSFLDADWDLEKLPGETTAIYQAAADLFQQIATDRRQSVHYSFSTMFPNMVEWARHHGDKIFHWNWVESGPVEADMRVPDQLRGKEDLHYLNAGRRFEPKDDTN